MAEPFIFMSTAPVREGRRESLEKRFRVVADKVEAREPKMLHFALYLSEDGTEETTLQVHADAENMALHMQLVAEHVEESQEDLDFAGMSIEVYGNPTDPILDQMRRLAGSGVSVSLKRPVVGFERFG